MSHAASIETDPLRFVDFTELQPGPHQTPVLDSLFAEVVAWSEALTHVRQPIHAA